MMNRMAWITGILTGLMVLLAALGALGAAVTGIAGDEAFYGAQSRQAVMRANGFSSEEEVTAAIGLDAQRQQAAAAELAAYVSGKADALPEMLNEKERLHMADVRRIIMMTEALSRTCLTLAAALAVATAWTGARLKRRRLPGLFGGLAAVGLLALTAAAIAGGVASGGFARMFAGLHEALFDNDLWLMSPQTDVLIRMMPQTLFEQALLDAANRALRMLLIVWILLIALHAMVQGMIRRHLSREEAA